MTEKLEPLFSVKTPKCTYGGLTEGGISNTYIWLRERMKGRVFIPDIGLIIKVAGSQLSLSLYSL